MKLKLTLLTLVIAIIFGACTPSANDCIKIYENGIDRVMKASTKQELSQITYDVKDELTDLGNKPGGDKKMSAEDTQKVLAAQSRFNRAVEQRSMELSY
jgi:hypothetical protein